MGNLCCKPCISELDEAEEISLSDVDKTQDIRTEDQGCTKEGEQAKTTDLSTTTDEVSDAKPDEVILPEGKPTTELKKLLTLSAVAEVQVKVETSPLLLTSLSSTQFKLCYVDDCRYVDIKLPVNGLSSLSPLVVPRIDISPSIVMDVMWKVLNPKPLDLNRNILSSYALDSGRMTIPHSYNAIICNGFIELLSRKIKIFLSVCLTSTHRKTSITGYVQFVAYQENAVSFLPVESVIFHLSDIAFDRAQKMRGNALTYGDALPITDLSLKQLGQNHQPTILERALMNLYWVFKQWSSECAYQATMFRKQEGHISGIESDSVMGWSNETFSIEHLTPRRDQFVLPSNHVKTWIFKITNGVFQHAHKPVNRFLPLDEAGVVIGEGFVDVNASRIQSRLHVGDMTRKGNTFANLRTFGNARWDLVMFAQKIDALSIVKVSEQESKRPALAVMEKETAYEVQNMTYQKIGRATTLHDTDSRMKYLLDDNNSEEAKGSEQLKGLDNAMNDTCKRNTNQYEDDGSVTDSSSGADVSDVDSQASYGSLIKFSDSEDEQLWSGSSSSDEDSDNPWKLEKRTTIWKVIGDTVDNALFSKEAVKYLSPLKNDYKNDSNSETEYGEMIVAEIKKSNMIDDYSHMSHISDGDSDDSLSWDLGNENRNNVNTTYACKGDATYRRSATHKENQVVFSTANDSCSYPDQENETDCKEGASSVDSRSSDAVNLEDPKQPRMFRACGEEREVHSQTLADDDDHSSMGATSDNDTDGYTDCTESDTDDSDDDLSAEDIRLFFQREIREINLQDPKQSRILRVQDIDTEIQSEPMHIETDKWKINDEHSVGIPSILESQSGSGEGEIKSSLHSFRLNSNANKYDPQQHGVLQDGGLFVQDELRLHCDDGIESDDERSSDESDGEPTSEYSDYEYDSYNSETENDDDSETSDGDHMDTVDIKKSYVVSKHVKKGIIEENIPEEKDNDTSVAEQYTDDEFTAPQEENAPALLFQYPYFATFSSRREELGYLEWEDIPPVPLAMRRVVLDSTANYVPEPRSEEDRHGSIWAIREERHRRREEAGRATGGATRDAVRRAC